MIDLTEVLPPGERKTGQRKHQMVGSYEALIRCASNCSRATIRVRILSHSRLSTLSHYRKQIQPIPSSQEMLLKYEYIEGNILIHCIAASFDEVLRSSA